MPAQAKGSGHGGERAKRQPFLCQNEGRWRRITSITGHKRQCELYWQRSERFLKKPGAADTEAK